MTHVDQEITLEALRGLKHQYVALFQRWCKEVPPALLKTITDAKGTPRQEMFQFLKQRWMKLHQDINAALVLAHTNHIGPAGALARVVRENVLEMVACAFDDPQNDETNLHWLIVKKNKKNARALQRHCEAFVQLPNLSDSVKRRLTESMRYSESILTNEDDAATTNTQESALEKKHFRALAELNMQLLSAKGIDADILVLQVLDYWMECEAIHSGPNAFHLYVPNQVLGDERDAELAGLCAVRDLYSAKALVTASLLQVGELTGKIERPAVSDDLARVAKIAEELVSTLMQNAAPTDAASASS